MTINVCYEEGHTPGTTNCKVYGLGTSSPESKDGWTVYAVYDLEGVAGIADALLEALAGFEVDYSDPSFASVVPESANVVAGLLDTILARSDYADIPYRSLTRQWRADHWVEVVRRNVPLSDVRAP